MFGIAPGFAVAAFVECLFGRLEIFLCRAQMERSQFFGTGFLSWAGGVVSQAVIERMTISANPLINV